MKYYIIAGEASGDLHGSNLIKELKQKDTQAQFRFWGGDLMAEQAGCQPVKHYSQMAFMGFIKVAMNLRTIGKNIKKCKADIVDYNPDCVILIDFAGFNLRIAKFAKQIGLRTIFYISPKIWAWKQNRIKKIKKYIDKMLTILPFETEFYQKFDYEVEYVGNPILDAIKAHQCADTEEMFRAKHGLSNKPIIGLLAGSRKQEITFMLPIMLEASRQFPNYQFVVSGAPGVDKEFYSRVMENANVPIVYNQTYDLLQFCHAALVTSGTATLETALFSVPQVVCYKTVAPDWAYRIARNFLKVKWVSLVNLIANREVVKELVQIDFKTPIVVEELRKITESGQPREKMLEGYAYLHKRMGEVGASAQAAQAVVRFMNKK